ncbi:MAG: DUF1028 domain-containing protein [Gemmatimonadetes bacterium]|nr:DUF1028 domain-containing protein [Gemmatimonadota bacterium]
MRRYLLTLAGFLTFAPAPVAATWSIIAIDRTTGRVVISSATCAATAPNQLKLLQAIVVPGVAVAAAQAGVDRTHENQKLIFRELERGTPPADIIRMLEEDPNIERRQFGIIDLQGRGAGRSGSGNGAVSMDLRGESDDGIIWGVQGNIIATEEALTAAATIMQHGPGSIIDRVMLAMEVADARGGDRRCTCDSEPLPEMAPCNGKTAHVSYLLAADPDDAQGEFAANHPEQMDAPYNTGDYYLYLMVVPTNTTPEEDANPVRTLRMRYDAWKAANEVND